MKVVPERVWRSAAMKHKAAIYDLLRPGLISSRRNGAETLSLDTKHPQFNFLIEYYGLKGAKGVKRLARWPPGSHPGGILLEGATSDDFADTLHLSGCTEFDASTGAFYSPSRFVEGKSSPSAAAAPYVWYRNIMQRTLEADPVLYCYNLHEWSMQYQPTPDAPTPPSAKYQAHIPLRVSREVIQRTVERRGTHCTHAHALTYFSPSALPLNTPPAIPKSQILSYEQPACVHAHMDLLQYAVRLGPFLSSSNDTDDQPLLPSILQFVLQARELDVAASPYHVQATHGIPTVAVETANGRALYRKRQERLLASPVRQQLLAAYETFLAAAFTPDIIRQAELEWMP